jgi:hypothetical protein
VKRLAVVLLALLTMIPMTAAAGHRGERSIWYRITDTPTFSEGPLPVCEFTDTVAIEALSGEALGTTTLCVKKVVYDEGPPFSFTEYGRLEVDLPHGSIYFKVAFTNTFNADGTAAAHDARGEITGGTGRYRGATGNLRGSGPVLFDSEGTPLPFLTYRVKLDLRSR